MEQSIAKRSQTQPALGEGGGFRVALKIVGLVYGCNFFVQFS